MSSAPVVARQRAPYASDPARSRGRAHPEPESRTRTAFQRDRDRIIHSTAFRRLKHKTQVFVYHEGDHYRTRLTHSLEVAQVARSAARALGLDEDLAEALALAHDLGHTPFGHAGEEALKSAMAPFGGFDHNGQTFRILTRLEARYARFDGLNLTWETLEGVAKHNGPVAAGPAGDRAIPWAIAEYDGVDELALDRWPGPEAQLASLADDIAYHAHDVDDGLRAGLFDVDDLADLPLAGPAVREVCARHPGIETRRLIHETVRRIVDALVTDLLAETGRRLRAAAPGSADELRAAGAPVVGFSAPVEEGNRRLKEFLGERMYRHSRVDRMTGRAARVVRELFALLHREPDRLPEEWRGRLRAAKEETARARLVSDYIAGMTDRFAFDEHRRLLGAPCGGR